MPTSQVVSKNLRIRKRSGKVVDYQRQKITQAVLLCLVNGCARTADEATKQLAEKVTERVEKIVRQIRGSVAVEAVQDLVEQSLMALGEYEAARQYIIYREEHAKLREELPVDAATRNTFDEGCKYFTGVNRHIQLIQAFDKFARFNHDLKRREVWPESVARVMNYTKRHCEDLGIANVIGLQTFNELERSLLNLESAPSMRMLQMAGPALERCQVGVFNCAAQFMDGPKALADELYILMQGAGVGFSVEQRAIAQWPDVHAARASTEKPDTYKVPDTTEGWCDAVQIGVERWLDGGDIKFDTSGIRKEGMPLRIKGGRSSGPQPLVDVLAFTRRKIMGRAGSRLTDLDVHDIACYAHRIVQMGGVRRASGISLSDLSSTTMRDCKRGSFYLNEPQRTQANNSTVYNEKPDRATFDVEWKALAESGTGERGIFNRGSLALQVPARRATNYDFLCNPCGEILLRNRQFCNLSLAVARPETSLPELTRRIRLATVWGVIQSTMTRFNYIHPDWKKNCDEERLLGVDILGHLDNAILRPDSGQDHAAILSKLKQGVLDTTRDLATRLGIPVSAATTCNKPSGDSSVFLDTAAGFKGHHGAYFIRRIRLSPSNPIAKLLKDQGVPCHNEYDNSGLWVFEIPCKAPVANPVLLADQNALSQLEHWKKFKLYWTEHNPSVSVYVRESEWAAVGDWVYANWEIVGGLAFFPYDNSHYVLAPYEAIDEPEYQQRADMFPDIDWAKLSRYETEDMTTIAHQFACTGDRCSVA